MMRRNQDWNSIWAEGTAWLSVLEEGHEGLAVAEKAGVAQAYMYCLRGHNQRFGMMAFKLILQGWMGLHRWR